MTLLAFAAPAPPASGCGGEMWLEGTLEFRGDSWQVRVHREPGAVDSLEIDIPELVMSAHRVFGG